MEVMVFLRSAAPESNVKGTKFAHITIVLFCDLVRQLFSGY